MEEDSVFLVFFGNDLRTDNGSWMILKQLGFDLIKVLLGEYPFLLNGRVVASGSEGKPNCNAEGTVYEYSANMSEFDGTTGQQGSQDPVRIALLKRKKTSAAEWGC